MRSDLFYKEKRALRRIFSLCVAAAGFTLVPGVCLFFLSDSLPGERSVPSLEDRVRETLLLVWVHPFGVRMPMPDCRERFEISGCEITDDQNRYGQADAVLIHHREISSGAAPLPPEPRPPAQNWIWLNLESPSHSSRLWEYEGIYNLTLSYRQDSDVCLPYGFLIPRALLHEVPRSRSAYPLGGGTSPSDLPRPRLVAWVVSNWSGARVAFYKLLAQHVQVDVFGRAGEPIPPGGRRVVHLIRRYRFYLALENSQHTDYITEKLWNAVRGGAIPVVLGPSRKNYERFLPPEAFIHVDDFPTVQELAQYLLKVKDSPSLIQMHLSWRRDYSVYIPSMWDEHFCTACRAAQKNHGRINVVNNLSKWFYS
ncbi:alpha-(1,3)-fucosyltransferase 4-like [Salarias fasciatus]|uniref:Fucosyltransferase n=1 Tax=Salarias fasciatus TaxID=181472 RepID=A0A672F4M1_SALFA|nr:alpha-(1,3)-fucosyltransferase 4-like [Salarias fasciatus]